MSRRKTQQEVQDAFLHLVWKCVDYWDKESRTPDAREKLEGLAHSFLTLLDGMSSGFPGVEMYTHPHPADKETFQEEGEDWWPELEDRVSIHGQSLLNDIFYSFGRKHGYVE